MKRKKPLQSHQFLVGTRLKTSINNLFNADDYDLVREPKDADSTAGMAEEIKEIT